MAKTGKVYYGKALAGIVSETDDGYEFEYNKAYLKSVNVKPVSLTLPLKQEVYTSKVLFPFFDGLIPEGWLLNMAIDHWKVKPNDRFELLLLTCADAVGAVSVQPAE